MVTRRVVLLCGPPGAGKTTLAHTLAQVDALTVYDSDDPKWTSERQFREVLQRLGNTPGAHAVVIRSGATRSARTHAAELIGATEVRVLDTQQDICIERVTNRSGPQRSPVHAQIVAIKDWWSTYEPGLGRPSRQW